MIILKICDYFWWIANLGVVPLFLSAAFLFLPAFFTLLALTIFVLAVLDAIILSPLTWLLRLVIQNKHQFLTLNSHKVKALSIYLVLASLPSLAQESFFMAKGEQIELKLDDLVKFSIGNPQVITHKYLKTEKKFLIKANKLGFSDLVIWTKAAKKSYHFYVLSKLQHSNQLKLSESIKALSLNAVPKGEFIIIEGELRDITQIKALHQLVKLAKNKVLLKTYISPKLQIKIISEIYQDFLDFEIDSISCLTDNSKLTCHYQGDHPLIAERVNYFENLYGVQFQKRASTDYLKNFQIKLKIIQHENSHFLKAQTGLDIIEAQLAELFDYGLGHIVRKNALHFQQGQEQVNLLAEPETYLRLGEEVEFKVGAEIQFQGSERVDHRNLVTYQWKFAGLKLKLKLTQENGRYLIRYHTTFSLPSENSISGSESTSTLYLDKNTSSKLFQVGYSNDTSSKKGLPLLSDIPILGQLFSDNSNASQYKNIVAFIQLEELP
jgi:Flp pilus assembly secretin CpaC